MESLGVGGAELLSDEQVAFGRVGSAGAWLGYDGILVPSAHAPGVNLVVFVNVQEPDLPLEPVSHQSAGEDEP